jgi:hypothetical protein
MAAELEVRLSADIKKLQSELNKAERELRDFGKAADREGAKAQSGLTKAGKGAANATPALLEFNRVIQDAPFGIMGVGNNIQQLTANFGSLSQKTGGTTNAIKAMVAGLSGPQGVLLAISAVTSLLTVFRNEIGALFSQTQQLTDSTKEFVSEARSEISTLKSLVEIAENTSLSYKVRQGAIERLNEKYPEYLGNITQETINTNEAKAAVDGLTKSLISQAKIKGVQDAIRGITDSRSQDLTKGLLERQQAARDVEAEIKRLSETYKDFFKVEGGIPLGQQTTQAVRQLEKNLGGLTGPIGSRLNELLGKFTDADKNLKGVEGDIQERLNDLENILNNFTISSLSQAGELFDGDEVIVKPIKEAIEKSRKALEATPIYTPEQLVEIFGLTPEAEEKLASAAANLNETVKKALQGAAQPVKALLSEKEKLLNEFNQNANNIIQRGIANTFADFGQVIGEGLVEGGVTMNRVGSALLGGFGSILIQLGELAIQTGVSMLAVFQALKTLNPWVAIAAGVALVAIGSAFSSGARQLAPSTGGSGGGAFGGASSNTIAGQGAQQGTASNSNSFGVSGSSGGTVVFEIQGQKLIGVLNNTLRGNSRLGGNLALG